MKLIDILLEENNRPKAIIMAGASGAGKSTLLRQLPDIGFKLHNPDRYVEDEGMHLATASKQVEKDIQDSIQNKENFIWDTTAGNKQSIIDIINSGYDVMMIMVYTNPLISFLNNFSRQERRTPKAAIFSSWKNTYQLIDDYKKLLGDNFLLYINPGKPEDQKKAEEFSNLASKGGQALEDYILNLTSEDPEKYRSTFSKPFDIENPEAKKEFEDQIKDLEFDRENESILKDLKKYFMQTYEKKGTGPGPIKMKSKLETILRTKEKAKQSEKETISTVAAMLSNPKFKELLDGKDVNTIISKVKSFS